MLRVADISATTDEGKRCCGWLIPAIHRTRGRGAAGG